MKQSVFTKELSASGKQGQFKGEIKVTMNYTTKLITGTHAATHDDYAHNVPVHKVEAFVDGKLWDKEMELREDKDVLKATEKLLAKTQEHLMDLATNEPVKGFTDKMNDLFAKY